MTNVRRMHNKHHDCFLLKFLAYADPFNSKELYKY